MGSSKKHASLSSLPKDVVPPTDMAADQEESCGQVEKTQEAGGQVVEEKTQESGGHGAALTPMAKKKFEGSNSSSARLRVKRAASYFFLCRFNPGGGGRISIQC
jgi:hypothetical protein